MRYITLPLDHPCAVKVLRIIAQQDRHNVDLMQLIMGLEQRDPVPAEFDHPLITADGIMMTPISVDELKTLQALRDGSGRVFVVSGTD